MASKTLTHATIVFFEAARRGLGHVELLDVPTLRGIGELTSEEYVAAVEAVANASEEAWWRLNPRELHYPWRGVTPDSSGVHVEHTTCSGDTTIAATPPGWSYEGVVIKRRRPLEKHHLVAFWEAAASQDLEGVIDALVTAVRRDYWEEGCEEEQKLDEFIQLLRETGLPPVTIRVDTPDKIRERLSEDISRLADILGKDVGELTLTDILGEREPRRRDRGARRGRGTASQEEIADWEEAVLSAGEE